jgi:hypothetical protein
MLDLNGPASCMRSAAVQKRGSKTIPSAVRHSESSKGKRQKVVASVDRTETNVRTLLISGKFETLLTTVPPDTAQVLDRSELQSGALPSELKRHFIVVVVVG